MELPRLKHYEITTRTTDMIEDAAPGCCGPRLDADGRIGMSASAGGAARSSRRAASIRDRIAFVMAFGGHADLPRTLRFLHGRAAGRVDARRTTTGSHRAPGAADRVVPHRKSRRFAGDRTRSVEARHGGQRPRREVRRAKTLATSLEEPSRTYGLRQRATSPLGPVLLPFVGELGGDPALSPARSPFPAAPVYLLHGTGDNVVPAIESTLLAMQLTRDDHTVHVLLTPLITHAEVDRTATAQAVWQLIDFWARLLNE